jgi:hypothetical protein
MEAIVVVSQGLETERVLVSKGCRDLYFGSSVRDFEGRERVHGVILGALRAEFIHTGSKKSPKESVNH